MDLLADPAGVLVSGGLFCLLVCVAVSGGDMTCVRLGAPMFVGCVVV